MIGPAEIEEMMSEYAELVQAEAPPAGFPRPIWMERIPSPPTAEARPASASDGVSARVPGRQWAEL